MLPDGNVIFICTFDPFGKGLATYSFENVCLEDSSIRLGDQTHKRFYNCTCENSEMSKELRSLYRYIQYGKAESTLTRKIHQAVVTARMRTEWRSEYMKELLRYEDAREEGATDKLTEQICRKYIKGKNVEQIADELEESIEHVEEIYARIRELAETESEIAGDADALYEKLAGVR